MAHIAFILLCHKDPEAIIAQARRLTAAGDFIAIHFDARANPKDFDRIRTALGDNPNVAFAARRVKCGWGEWSLVQATLNAVAAAEAAFPTATHFYMLSGDCMPIKSARYVHDFLDANDRDFIESFDFFTSEWIKTGFKEERLVYRHFFNERTQAKRFYFAFEMQRRFHITRRTPPGLQIMIGSQWWCLRRRTVEAILGFIRRRRDIMRFFRTTWIPDETFFQTLVPHLVPDEEIERRTLTFLMFSDYGMPVNFYNDQYDLLLSQNYLFARKISPEALDLKSRLGDLYASDRAAFDISDEGRTLYRFLVGRGRVGRRFATRFWESESTLGRERELLVVVCKKWHVAKRLVQTAREVTKLHGVEYLFDEEHADLPDLGGIQTTLTKRTRHRRAMMRMLFDFWGTNRLIICLDPRNLDLLQDFHADRCELRILELACNFEDEYLAGHAKRVGLAGETTPHDTLMTLVPTIRHEFAFEAEALRDAGFAHYFTAREDRSPEDNAHPIASFFKIDVASGQKIAETPYLFSD